MDMAVYKMVHMLGLVLLFQSLGASLLVTLSGMDTSAFSNAKMARIMHGVGIVLILVGGFGMMARLGISWPLPIWIWIKLIIWIVLGLVLTIVKKKPESTRLWWTLVIVFGALAAYLGGFKPF